MQWFELEVYPSFEMPSGIRIRKGGRGWVVSKRRGEAEPIEDHLLDEKTIEPLLNAIHAIHIPLSAAGPEGMDGTSFTFRHSIGMTAIEISWWEDLPEPWLALQPIVDFLRGL